MRAGSKAGGDIGGGDSCASGLESEFRLDGEDDGFMARAMADRVELLRDPGERCIR